VALHYCADTKVTALIHFDAPVVGAILEAGADSTLQVDSSDFPYLIR
jgi:hypothetical protein